MAILVAFTVGLVGALSLRGTESRNQSLRNGPSSLSEVRQEINWRVPVAFGTNLPALGDNILDVSEALAAVTNGRIRLKVFEPGLLVPPFSITESVKERKIEAGYTWLGYDQGRIPATPLIAAVPFGMEPWEFATWHFEDGGKALAESLYHPHNVHPIFCGLVGLDLPSNRWMILRV